jgi:tetratricopeptide (TPR) repeat protein
LQVKKTSSVKYYLAASAALMTLLVYLPALHNNFVEWDDGDYASANLHIRSLDVAFLKWAFLQFFASNWHPLTWISHALDYSLWGLNPMGHHLTSVILHTINTFLVVVLVIRLLDVYRTKQNSPQRRGDAENSMLKLKVLPSYGFILDERAVLIAAGTTGLLFGLHPLHVESVAWVAERKDLLCALFFLLSIMMYAKYVGVQGSGVRGQESGVRSQKLKDSGNAKAGPKKAFINKHYLFTLGFFILALLSKPMAVTLPVVLLILDWHPFDRIRSLKTFQAVCVEKLPFFILSLASSIVTVFAQRAGGALSSVAFTPLPTRVLVAAKAVIDYLGKMAWPLNLIPFYPYPKTASFTSWEYFAPAALAAGITVLCAVLAIKKHKMWLTAWGYYVVTLVPVLGIVQVGGQSMADRYTYLPSLGPFLVIGLGTAWLWEKARAQQKPGPFVKLFIGSAAACMVFFLSFATIEQTGVWKNSLSLWTYVIAREPDVSLAYNNRGLTYDELGRLDLAIEDFDRAIELDPSDHKAYTNRGMLYGKMGRFDKAIADFEQAIVLEPSHAEAYNNLGIAYAKVGLVDKALEQFNKTILIDPDQAMAYYNRGLLYLRTGDKERASVDYQKACDLGNDDACKALK